MNRQTFKPNFGGGQRVISTDREFEPNFIVNVLLDSAKMGKELVETLDSFQGRNYSLASDLLLNDPRLSNLNRNINVDDNCVEDKPRAFNRTKMLKKLEEEKQKLEKEKQEKENELIRLKARLLKEKRAA